MSHFTKLKATALVKNEEDLIAALKAHFGANAVEVHDTAVKLQGMDARGGQKANLIVRRKDVRVNGGYNDMGYERQEDGTYLIHVDSMDVHQNTMDGIHRDYAERVVTRKLKSEGYLINRKVLPSGEIKIEAEPL